MEQIITSVVIVAIITIVFLFAGRIYFRRTDVDEYLKKTALLRLVLPAGISFPPDRFVAALGLLHDNLVTRTREKMISLEIISGDYGTHFLVACEHQFYPQAQEIFAELFPEIRLDIVDDYAEKVRDKNLIAGIEIGLGESYYLPIKTFNQFSEDTMLKYLQVLSDLEPGQQLWLQLIIRAVDNEWADYARMQMQSKPLGLMPEMLSKVESKMQDKGFQFVMRILTRSANRNYARILLENLRRDLFIFTETELNTLAVRVRKKEGLDRLRTLLFGKDTGDKLDLYERYQLRFLDAESVNILSLAEVATLYHIPPQDFPGLKPRQESVEVVAAQQTLPAEIPQEESKQAESVVIETQEIPSRVSDPANPLSPATEMPKAMTAEEFEEMGNN